MTESIQTRAKKIKMLMLDVDGVLTDAKMTFSKRDDESKAFDVRDGLGVMLLKKAHMKCVILTAKGSPIVRRRAKMMHVDKVYGNCHYKLKAYEKIKKRFRLSDEEICFVGDDIIDAPVLKHVGLAVAVPNAVDDVKDIAHYITKKEGGNGAVREVCELILKAQGQWEEVTRDYLG